MKPEQRYWFLGLCLAFAGGCSSILGIESPSQSSCTSSDDCPDGDVCDQNLTCMRPCVGQTCLREASVLLDAGPSDGAGDVSQNNMDIFVAAEALDGIASETDIEAEAGSPDSADEFTDATDANATEPVEESDVESSVDDGEAAAKCVASRCSDGGCSSSVILFGGADANGALGGTWQWDGSQWSELHPLQSPAARFFGAMSTACSQLMLFGGLLNDADPLPRDQWAWNGRTWSPLPSSTLPSARVSPAVAKMNGIVLLFGGMTDDPDSPSILNDTWLWDGTNWSKRELDRAPGPRVNAAAAEFAGGIVLFGGDDVNGNALGDTWIWDGAAWTEQHPSAPPPARYDASAATLNGEAVLFGGWDGMSPLNDTWVWGGTGWRMERPLHVPNARFWGAMSAMGDHIMLFGGKNGAQNFGDTWVWDGGDWTSIAVPGPSARYASMVAVY